MVDENLASENLASEDLAGEAEQLPPNSGTRNQEPETGVKSQGSGVKSKKSEIKNQESGVRSQESGEMHEFANVIRMQDRLDAPAYHENIHPILSVLEPLLAGVEGNALEIGSGSGQHILRFAQRFPGLTWWPSDIAPGHLRSIRAWRQMAALPNLENPIALDAAALDWRLGQPVHPPGQDLRCIVCINVVHISPWSATEGLFAGAAKALAPGGLLYLYGPYARGGFHTAPSNARFDQSLRAQDPAWGVRDLEQMEKLGVQNGFLLEAVIDMPVNNFSLVFRKK